MEPGVEQSAWKPRRRPRVSAAGVLSEVRDFKRLRKVHRVKSRIGASQTLEVGAEERPGLLLLIQAESEDAGEGGDTEAEDEHDEHS